MSIVNFTKMQGSGNDFIVLDGKAFSSVVRRPSSVVKLCDRKFGVGADGILLLERSQKADVRMRIFNADGSEAQMCGNGARCAALYLSHQSSVRGRQPKTKKLKLETKAGMINAEVRGNSVKINLTDPVDIRLDLTVKISGKNYEVDFIDTGVPHAVVEIKGLDKVPVRELGRLIRHHGLFRPVGTNVDFVNVVDRDHILVRTYERGVEDETLACGTGSVASAIITTLNSRAVIRGLGKNTGHKVFVKTKGGESLVVYFKILKKKITDVWLEGRAEIVFTGRMLLA